jgi:hypothetical protein
MTFNSGNIYNATIGSFEVGNSINYYITAFDTIGNEAINDNHGNYHHITIYNSVTTTPVPITYFIPFIIMISLIVLIRKRK